MPVSIQPYARDDHHGVRLQLGIQVASTWEPPMTRIPSPNLRDKPCAMHEAFTSEVDGEEDRPLAVDPARGEQGHAGAGQHARAGWRRCNGGCLRNKGPR